MKEETKLLSLSEDSKNEYVSTRFSEKANLIDTLLNTQPSNTPLIQNLAISNAKDPYVESFNRGSDKIVLYTWKNTENISSRLLEVQGNTIVLECLIDKENGVYEEREFPSSLFKDYDIKIGNYFYLRFFERPNEIRLEIHDDPGLISEKDFPKLDFNVLFKKSKLFS